MPSREIPRENWEEFFDQFSCEHQDWPASLLLLGGDFGARPQTSGNPLIGISFDAESGEGGVIDLIFGTGHGGILTHRVEGPTRVWYRDDAAGARDAIEIETGTGPTALVHFATGRFQELPAG